MKVKYLWTNLYKFTIEAPNRAWFILQVMVSVDSRSIGLAALLTGKYGQIEGDG